ncbi:MAG: hypothetical protein ABMB14_25835 [Myxococcota bacterium]
MQIIETLQAFRRDELDPDTFLRALVAHPAWQVVVDERQHAQLWTVGDTTYLAAMAEPSGPGDAPLRYLAMRGRHLVRNLPPEADGVGFELGRPHGLGLTREDWPRLLAFASALDVEEALEAPAPGQAPILHAHAFLVLCNEGGPVASPIHGVWGLTVFTSPDRLRAFLEREPWLAARPAEPMTLGALAERVDGRVDFDAVWIDPHHEPRVDPLAPGAVSVMRAGLDPRPEARILRARTIAELHTFLDQERMVREDRAHTLAYDAEDTLVAHYTGTVLGRRARSYRFEPVTPTPDPLALGDGPSELLCAGFLLEEVDRRLSLSPASPSEVGPVDRAFVAETAALARALSALLGDAAELPRATLRTVRGAAFVRKRYELADPAWIRSARDRAEALADTAPAER